MSQHLRPVSDLGICGWFGYLVGQPHDRGHPERCVWLSCSAICPICTSRAPYSHPQPSVMPLHSPVLALPFFGDLTTNKALFSRSRSAHCPHHKAWLPELHTATGKHLPYISTSALSLQNCLTRALCRSWGYSLSRDQEGLKGREC